ncbi:hypothetical protein HO173_013244 [Letharia columbiana]|uniref:Tc1-like transposase DDE domain-containing protein n=1 Tax=Letharia columbiana TaxID=112416 RepID=A0A8H6CGN6_9LECA|nr:uncharacterized protein HO173_013244 [Letharia columbiana]KAF6223169.1 hypothetical protein HO173_013244 [Letharia columbiana]
MQAGWVLREEGPDQRYAPENVAEIPPLEGVVLHMSAFVSYYHKGDLHFYNDPDDVPELNVTVQVDVPKRKRPPKQRKSETEEQFLRSERYLEWLAAEPHDVEVQPKENSITQIFYTKKILPSHLKEMQEVERKTGKKCVLQKDNNPSHGTQSAVNYAREYKRKHNIETLKHPAQSPDLNPIEAVWNILKQRMRHRK